MKRMKDMPYVIGAKIRIFPSDEQRHMIDLNIGAQRFIYNRLVARDREIHSLQRVKIFLRPVAERLGYLLSLSELPSDLQNSYPFLADERIDAQTIANGIKNYHTAWHNFKTVPGTSVPCFHKKQAAGSYQTNPHYKKNASHIWECNVHLDERKAHVVLPKLGSVHFKDSGTFAKLFERKCETRIGTITVSRDACGDYHASFQIGSVSPFKKEYEPLQSPVGLDVNVKNYYTDSDGIVVENPKYLQKETAKLAKQQRKLSHMQDRAKKEGRRLEDSRNYQKQRKKVAQLHRSVARKREAFLNRISKDVVKNHDIIVVENLKVRNLLKNHCLAKSIADCSWSSFFSMLGYKSELYGRTFLKVPPNYTTQTCSACGYRMEGEQKLTLKERCWVCPSCGKHHDRDHNSAVNIKNKGLALLCEA